MEHVNQITWLQERSKRMKKYNVKKHTNPGLNFDYVTEVPLDFNDRLTIQRYLTWLAWKGQDTAVDQIRIRSWKNIFRSFRMFLEKRSTTGYANLLFSTLIPVIPLKAWIAELRRIVNGISPDDAKELVVRIYVPGYAWKAEAAEVNGIQTVRFVGRKC